MKTRNKALVTIHLTLLALYAAIWIVLTLKMFLPLYFVRNVLLFIVVPHGLASVWAYQGNSKGRILSNILGVMLLFGIPIGTILGIAILRQTGDRWVSANSEAA
jgi:hypothetical protein